MQINECVQGSGKRMHGEIVSPNGHYLNTRYSYYRSNGNCTPTSTFTFNRNVTPGWWQFRGWQKISAHDYRLLETLYLQVQ
jgi:hypothetical protein